ncbi:Eco57I restriction-modification methylase domain-containing protein [Gallibacter intestinalis]|uniref:site-specific DNA-methyltransferase (adenine-specific) n=1 Tax=Gallibacter intestinalis TaxID=2779356 RepID=A0ABR9QXI4_9FIRM|nr:Eco57I restriction-modification methylase domain-containing protein [Gallibacter intestinalis]MBE5035275.1 Eco57I restriction-modification methylase domain-containing protein [Gallibacter intestinalis]
MKLEIKRIEEILTSTYENKAYVELIKILFPKMESVNADKFSKTYSSFSSHIEGSSHVGNIKTKDDKKILVLSVQLKKERYVENARSVQRSFAKHLIDNGSADAAIIAFYTPNESKWRLSFVRLDYEIKIENGRLKTQEKITPAKRYSYLVGENEPCHTAISRISGFITAEHFENGFELDELEEVFSVERVTKEFFNLYCEKYYQLQEFLDSCEDFVDESERCGFTSEQFAKKLMGQIVFLYFLQKKGWLGVNTWPTTLTESEYKDVYYTKGAHGKIIKEYLPKMYGNINGEYCLSSKAFDNVDNETEEIIAMHMPRKKTWGDGSQTFLRTLFEFSKKHGGHFYENYLEPLFYDALNRNRGEMGYCTALHCRVPFLSGGLFEALDGYDWKANTFDIPDEIFSNRKDDNDREGDGILDIFDRFNFTISEDEPMEREVAIDPEMLGKVFENLLEIKDRKSKGAFYTPREIVHFMCQESLIQYLIDNLHVSDEAVRNFILYGEYIRDHDAQKDCPEDEMLISDELYNRSLGINKLNEMDELLSNIKIADPAVGSGAFPLGMLNEIVKARQNISRYMAMDMNPNSARFMYATDRSAYSLKYETIKNCIFATDIEPSAVDITQLRLWLSLVIDDEINPNAQTIAEGHKDPLPLPNLECNILCGNSLIDKLDGENLINGSEILGNIGDETQIDFVQTLGEYDAILDKFIKKQEELFKCKDSNEKKAIKREIEDLKNLVVHKQLYSSEELFEKYLETEKMTSKPYVLWQLDFARVFKEKRGFDIVIGNPPYIQLQKTINEETKEKLGDAYSNLGFETFTKTGDIYCLFYEKGYHLLHNNGILTFITSNKWMRAGYGKALREFLSKKTNPILLIDFAGRKIFESATVDVNILMYSKEQNMNHTFACKVDQDCGNNLSVFVQQNQRAISYSASNSWVIISSIEAQIKKKIEEIGTPLEKWNININRGVLTGYNEAFIISTEKKNEIVSADPKSAEIIRPILRGRDINYYACTFAGLWLINTHNGIKEKNIPPINIDDYPAIKKHLDKYQEKLFKRADQGITPYNLRNCVYMDEFFKQKIIYPNMTKYMPFVLDDEQYMTNQKCFIITGEHLPFLTAFFNSSLFKYCFRNSFPELQGGTRELSKIFFEKIPVIRIDEQLNQSFANAVKNIQKEYTDEKAKEIDEMIFDLYELSSAERDEIGFIEIK